MTFSHQLFAKAEQLIPGGVNSPVRAFKGVGCEPVFIKKGVGAHIIDVDDREYIDYVCSWGALILGHCHADVINSVTQALHMGMSFGAPVELEIKLAEKVIELMPSIEKIRMVNSGTEATMTAIRLARGFTGKSKIIKFNGCYHGHSDSLLVKAGSGLLTLGIPSCPGVLDDVTKHTLCVDFNDIEAVGRLFECHANDIAAVIVEPVAGNMGMILPQPHFLPGLRSLCDQYQSVLIFDEVMTGFRVALGGAQSLYQVTPDLTTLGKVIGGGMPVGAIGGKHEIMSCLAPAGPVYQAGTLSGNPLAMAAGLATLTNIQKSGFYQSLSQMSSLLIHSLKEVASAHQVPFHGVSLGGMFGYCFTHQDEIMNYHDVAASDEALFRHFFQGMLREGVSFAPSLFEAGFITSVHDSADITKTQLAAERVLQQLK